MPDTRFMIARRLVHTAPIRFVCCSLLYVTAFFLPLPVAIAESGFVVDGFAVDGENPLGKRKTTTVLAPYIGQHEGIDRLQQAASALELALAVEGYDFHRVTLPPQVVDSGSVILEIRSLVVGEISTSGNQHFSADNLRRSLPQLKPGETPNTHSLSKSLALANRNSAKRTHVTFERGTEADTLDTHIEVEDGSPRQFYGWLNNYGTAQTTRTRLGLGFQHVNLFDRDHGFTATYTTSPENTDNVSQYGFSYLVPFYSIASTLTLFYADSDIDSGRIADVFDVGGVGRTTGLRYTQLLYTPGLFNQQLYVDVVDQLFDNQVDYFGNDIGVDVRSRPLTGAWQIEWQQPGTTGHLNISLAVNLDGGRYNDQLAYSASRPGAPQDWQALRFNAQQEFSLPREMQLSLAFQGQWTGDPMISGEQLGLGGSIGPRGFDEREGAVDRGASMRAQWWLPAARNQLQFGLFLDYAAGTNIQIDNGEDENLTLSSIGATARWEWKNQLLARVDIGHVLQGFDDNPALSQDGDNHASFSIVYRFATE